MAEIDSRELENFESQTRSAQPRPGEIPEIRGFDICGETFPYRGRTGGDHIIYLDFKKRYDLDGRIRDVLDDERFTAANKRRIVENIRQLKTKGGLMIADVAGHFRTDFSFAVRLHDAFLKGESRRAADLQVRIVGLNNLVTREGGVPALKAAMDLMGLAGGLPRPPLLPADAGMRERLQQALSELELLDSPL